MADLKKYNITEVNGFSGLANNADKFTGGIVGPGILMIIWVISFYMVENFTNKEAIKSSTWVTFLSSLALNPVGIVSSNTTLMLFIVVVVISVIQYNE